MIRELRKLDVQIDVVPRLFEMVGPNAGIHAFEGLPLVGLPPARLSPSSRLLKRALDYVVALAMLVVLGAADAADRARDPARFARARASSGSGGSAGTCGRSPSSSSGRCAWTPTRRSTARYIESTMTHQASPNGNGLYKLDRVELRHPRRAVPAEDEPRRAAAAAQRPGGRDVARRPAPLPRLRDRGVRASTTSSGSSCRRA